MIYEAVQVGFLDMRRSLASRSVRGHVAKLESKRSKARAAAGVQAVPKADCEAKRFVREFRTGVEGFQVGQQIKVDIFANTLAVDVMGISKGRGTAGLRSKRHNFARPSSQSRCQEVHRHVGSIGMNTDPHHVFKGHKMAGHMGVERVTIRNMAVARVDAENNLLLIRGTCARPA